MIEAIQRESRGAVTQMAESNKTVNAYMLDTSVSNALERIIESVRQIVPFTREIELSDAMSLKAFDSDTTTMRLNSHQHPAH